MASVLAVCISEKRGTKKKQVPFIDVKINHGIIGDAHAGNWHRQISLLAQESIDKMLNLGIELSAGDFAENIVTKGITLKTLPVGTKLLVGETILEVTQIGKECHNDCEIKRLVGKCVMPTEGIFAKVIKEGRIQNNDLIEVLGE
ncbi:MAG: MOSC domain-containing protein [Ruminococcus sp.]|nr:MOSC domain-containing protein [Ruminococcus sp.]